MMKTDVLRSVVLAAAVICTPAFSSADGERAAADQGLTGVPAGWSFGSWQKQPTEPYRGKQDDIVFVTPEIGYYGNGQGRIYKTSDGGASWTRVLDRAGLFVRCLGFLDEETGFAGNVGPGYFPGVEDETLLYRTDDGGATWAKVEGLDGTGVRGLCAIQVLRYPYINAGVPGEKTLIVAGGRVGGPAYLLLSDDLGGTWRTVDLREHGGMVLDVHFFTDRIGVVATSSSTDIQESHARILMTEDGGESWRTVYESDRPFELTWKLSFPTRSVGYCTVQSYNPDPAASARFIAKTTDGGRTWTELPLVDDASVREFGVGFVDERTGFVGAMPHGFVTTDGGETWAKTDFGPAVNKIRVLPIDEDGDTRPERFAAFAIGVQVHRLDGERREE